MTTNDIEKLDILYRWRNNSTNPFNKYGHKVFSQNDEDGLTLEIIKRIETDIKIPSKHFLEIGIGNGTECNSLVLLATGWEGVWIDPSPLYKDLVLTPRVQFVQDYVTPELSIDLLTSKQYDFISVDIDGKDYYVVKSLLKVQKPLVWVVEYNAKFIPPIKFIQDINEEGSYLTDYFGVSLQSYVDLFSKHGYFLIVCNSDSGTNAFFVSLSVVHLFPEKLGLTTRDMWIPPRYNQVSEGHMQDIRTINTVLKCKS